MPTPTLIPAVARFSMSGMSCQACAASVEGLLRSVDGIREAEVRFGSRSAEVALEGEGPGSPRMSAAGRIPGFTGTGRRPSRPTP